MCWRAGDPWAPLNCQDPLFRLTSLQTQTVDAAVQTTQDKPTDIKTTAQQKSITANQNKQSCPNDSTSSQNNAKKLSSTPAQAKAPSSPNQTRHKSPNKIVSDRLPKGSDDEIKQYNRFSSLDEDMEADDSHAESNMNKQGRIIKLNNKRLKITYFHLSVVSTFS